MKGLEDLNTELLYEIFDYLSFTQVFLAFFNLQQRINNAIRAYPACIDLSKTIDRNALSHDSFACRALIILGDDILENTMNCLHLNFEAIRAISCKYVNFTTLQLFFEQIPMEQLESIEIEHLDRRDAPEDMDQELWSTIAIAGRNQLRHLCTSLHIIQQNTEQLLFDLPTLQYAVLKYISSEAMLAFVRHTPNLCSFTGRVINWNNESCTPDFSLPRLVHLNLLIERCSSFEELRQLLFICPNLTHCELRFWITWSNVSMVDATGWQALIEQCLPCLIYLRIRLFRYVPGIRDSDPQEAFNRSEYWTRQQPHFDIQVR
ncbi:unnamed protein product [Rotaria sp. Silwood1]|nr:unnamed protein product [Rotaria sp. Silwood1]